MATSPDPRARTMTWRRRRLTSRSRIRQVSRARQLYRRARRWAGGGTPRAVVIEPASARAARLKIDLESPGLPVGLVAFGTPAERIGRDLAERPANGRAVRELAVLNDAITVPAADKHAGPSSIAGAGVGPRANGRFASSGAPARIR